ncbi:unnamed protein product, partial [marine sediment metagenome]
FFDGAMGTELIERGIVLGDSAERFSPYFSEIITEIHKAYFDAGSDVIQTNTYGANRIGLGPKLENKIELINLRQVELANTVCPKNGYVAGNIGPSAVLLEKDGGEYTINMIQEAIDEQVKALAKGGVDLFSIETMYYLEEALAAISAIKGSGYPARFPFIDLAEISSGGGSIAWVDQGSALRVGPISAGADPGPACYGQKGDDPTITDANLVLGRLNPEGLLNKIFKIYPELAEKSILKKIAEPLKLDVIESALGIVKIANNHMSRILRIVTVERGLDPREFILNAFGGAGPLHACDLAEELKINEIIIPNNPGLFSAMGLLFTDAKHTYVKSIRKNLFDIDYSDLEQAYQVLEKQGSVVLTEEGFKTKSIAHKRFVDLRYVGQGFELLIPLEGIALQNENCKDQILKRFN